MLLYGDWFAPEVKMISIDVSKFSKDLKKYDTALKESLEEVMADFITDFVTDLSRATPLGSVTKFYSLYLLRSKVKGYKIQAGLARGNWRVTFRNGVTGVVQNYYTNGGEAGADAFERMVENYTLGKKVYIVNNVDYIDNLNQGSSKKAPAGYIDAIVNAYTNFGKYRKRIDSLVKNKMGA